METEKSYNGIKSWAEDDRPREKLLNKGRASLSDSELVAILIGSGTKKETAVDVAKRLLISCNNNLNDLAKFSVKDFIKIDGIGEARAISVIAALELGNRRRELEMEQKTVVTSSADAYKYIRPYLSDLLQEEFVVLILNRANMIVRHERIAQGGLDSTVVDVRLILKHALDNYASSIIICHNHPSGNLKPSQNDISITQKIMQASKVMDLKLLDHLIVTQTSYYSFADGGILE